MKNKRIVIALGGNAIKQAHEDGTAEDQLKNVDVAAEQIACLVSHGYEIVITHGNGPQVGALLIQQENTVNLVPSQNLTVCGAMTQGQIGWMFQNRLLFHLKKIGIYKPVCALITQVKVSSEDPEFLNYSKPVGPFFSEEEAEKYQQQKGWSMQNVRPGLEKSWRRVVASPEPVEIIEAGMIKLLVENGTIVIASGGGGIPVYEDGFNDLKGIEAVIDKDKAGFVLAKAVAADMLVILTDVEHVYINFDTPDKQSLSQVSLMEVNRYFEDGQFAKGSMGPKVDACMRFVEWSGKEAIITSLNKAVDAVINRGGTHIKFEQQEQAVVF